MTEETLTIDPAINRGIKAVGVGKKGSKDLTAELAREILDDLKAGQVTDAAKGAFFAALSIKGVTPEEMALAEFFPDGTLSNPRLLAYTIAHDAPEFVKESCAAVLEQKELTRESAYQLGKFLLSDQPGDGARGLIASALRVRYETADEYEGLLLSLQDTIAGPFQVPVPDGDPVIQIAEPFDGVDHNYMLTPCVAQAIQQLSYRVISLVGKNSGPKDGINLYDIVRELNLPFLPGNRRLGLARKPAGGWFIDQKDLAPPLNRWVTLRRQTIKRPFLATLEKFLNPCQARILITSAFHGVYGEKMATIAERAGFPGTIVVRNGIEGTIAFPLTRAVKMLCSARKKDGSYQREEIVFDPMAFLGFEIPVEEKLDRPSLTENAKLIQTFLKKKETPHEQFNHRVAVTCAGLKQALDWVEAHLGMSA